MGGTPVVQMKDRNAQLLSVLQIKGRLFVVVNTAILT
jgi:hypothetical protein